MPLQQLQVVSHSALHRVADPGGAWLSLGQAELGGSVAAPETTPWGGGVRAQEAGSTPRSWVPCAQSRAVSTVPPCLGGMEEFLGLELGSGCGFASPSTCLHPWVLPKAVSGHGAGQRPSREAGT